jgi:uncharacterized damage-inducible protein DinB
MIRAKDSLQFIFEGWNGYNQSIINAIKPLSSEQLSWQPKEHLYSVGQVARHISLGRITWFVRMDAPGSAELAGKIHAWKQDDDGNAHIIEEKVISDSQPEELIHWLDMSWEMIEKTLTSWMVSDLNQTYKIVWNKNAYLPSRQWTIWRIMSHDIHHGGEMSLMLGMQGIQAFELSVLFGHTIMPQMEG